MNGLQAMKETPLALLRRALLAEDENLLAEVRRRSQEIAAQIEGAAADDGDGAELTIEVGNVSSEWVSKVYGALSGVEDSDAQAIEDETCVRELLETRLDWESSIGCAFREALLPYWIPTQLLDINAWFGSVPKAPSGEVERLWQTPAVQSGGEPARQLCVYGMTPLTVYRAVHAIYLLIDRLIDYEHLRTDRPILLSTSTDSPQNAFQRLDIASVTTAVEEYAACSREAASRLVSWLVQLGQYHPYLFYGLAAQPAGPEGLALRVSEAAKNSNLYKRWSVPAARAVTAGPIADIVSQPADGE